MTLRVVLFDAGDTLFRVRGSVGEVYATVAARHGVTVAAPHIEQRFRTAFRRMPPLAFPDARTTELPQREYMWWRDVVGTVFSDVRFEDFDAFFADLFSYFAEAGSWELFADAEPALAALRARGLQLAIVSNFDGRLTRICEGLGIVGYFDAIVMSGRAGAAKPDPRIFTVALTRLGVGADEALHVGDSDTEDIRGARAAGLRAIQINRAALRDSSDCVSDLRDLLGRLTR
jgi:putative hydrolase of the HAD superfamily